MKKRGLLNPNPPVTPNEQADAIHQRFSTISSDLQRDLAGALDEMTEDTDAKQESLLSWKQRYSRLQTVKTRPNDSPYDPSDPTLTEDDRRAQLMGAQTVISQLESELTSRAIPGQRRRNWIAWTLGKGREEDHRRTPWYRDRWQAANIPDIRNFIKQLVAVLYDTEAAMLKLILWGPTNARESEIYYHYIVDMSWMRTKNKFYFVDINEMIHGGMMGGGLTTHELDVLNFRMSHRSYPRDYKFKDNHFLPKDFAGKYERVAATDVFKLDERQREMYRGTRNEVPFGGGTWDRDNDQRVLVDTSLDQVKALSRNMNEMAVAGRNADSEGRFINLEVTDNYQNPKTAHHLQIQQGATTVNTFGVGYEYAKENVYDAPSLMRDDENLLNTATLGATKEEKEAEEEEKSVSSEAEELLERLNEFPAVRAALMDLMSMTDPGGYAVKQAQPLMDDLVLYVQGLSLEDPEIAELAQMFGGLTEDDKEEQLDSIINELLNKEQGLV